MTERAAPFYCPYCGDEDLRPADETAGSFDCRSCGRRFQLRYVGISHPAEGGSR